VADDWQRRGLAGRLLALLAERALEEGIERFRAPAWPTTPPRWRC